MGTFVVSDTREDRGRSLSEAEIANRQVVLDYYRAQVEKVDWSAMRPYLTDDFADHSPSAANGDLETLRLFCEGPLVDLFSDMSVDIKQVIVDGDLVVTHLDGRLRPADPIDMVLEIFRLRDGKISEHWELVGPASTRVIEEIIAQAQAQS